MNRILRMSDRVHLEIGGVKFVLAPLSKLHKMELLSTSKIEAGKESVNLFESQFLYIKYALKDVVGLKNYDGTDYKLEFEGDHLSDNSVNEIMHIEQRSKLNQCGWQLLNGITDLIDPITNKPIDDVSIEVKNAGK